MRLHTARLQSFFVWWTSLICRWAVLVCIGVALVSVAAVYYVSTHIGMNTDTSDMLSPDLPFRQDSIALSEAFPQFSDNIVIVLEGENTDSVRQAGDLLAQRLRAAPGVFGDVFDPTGDRFFRRNGFLYLDEGELETLANRLSAMQPFIGKLNQDPTLRGLAEMIDLAVTDWIGGDAPPVEAARFFNAMTNVAEGQLDGRDTLLSWQELMLDETSNGSVPRRVMVIQPAVDFSSLQPGSDAIGELRKLASDLRLAEDYGVRMRLTGSVPLSDEELASVIDGMGLAALTSFLLVFLFLTWGLKSWRMISATLASLIVGLILTAAFATAAVGDLNIISVAFAVLFIGLSVDFGIHYALRYREEAAEGASIGQALQKAAGGIGGALLLAAIAAAIGFFSFLPTDYLGLAQLGLISGVGMFIALFCNITVLPAVLTILGDEPVGALPAPAVANRATGKGQSRSILAASAVVAILAAVAASQVTFDFDPLNLKDPDTEAVSTLFDLLDDPLTNPYTITYLAKNIAEANSVAPRLSRLETVDSATTVLDLMPENQDVKLDIIADMALFLGPSLIQSASSKISDQARLESLYRIQRRLKNLVDALPASPLAPAATELIAALNAVLTQRDDYTAVKNLEIRLLSTLPDQIRLLNELLSAEPVAMENLPKSMIDRQVAADGRVRVEITPKYDVRDRANLVAFVEDVRSIVPRATGAPVVILEAGNTVIRSFLTAAAISIVIIAFLVAGLLRNLRSILLIFIPLIFAALLTLAASAVFSLPLNFANVIVLPLLFGLGVASGIHLVMREQETDTNASPMTTSTPRAVMFSALTTVGSFGSIALSSHPGTASMGVLLTVAIVTILIGMLVVLPAMMRALPPKLPPANRT